MNSKWSGISESDGITTYHDRYFCYEQLKLKKFKQELNVWIFLLLTFQNGEDEYEGITVVTDFYRGHGREQKWHHAISMPYLAEKMLYGYAARACKYWILVERHIRFLEGDKKPMTLRKTIIFIHCFAIQQNKFRLL